MISVIIPLHNLGSKGDYCLKRCLDSILAQTYTNYEVLLMENGSTDDTVEIAQEYCNKDDRFKLHILDTLGIANARNEGINKASGEYICLIDGDDSISNNFFEKTSDLFTKNKDIAYVSTSWAFYYENNKNIKFITKHNKDEIRNTSKHIDCDTSTTVWAKVIKKEFIIDNNIYLEKDIFGYDDFLFGNQLYLSSQKYAICADAVYYYTQNRNNQTTKIRLNNMTDGTIVLIEKLTSLYKKYNVYEENKTIIDNIYISLFIGSGFALTTIRKMDKKSIYNLINKEKNRLLQININNIQCKNWQKIWFKRFQKSIKHFGSFGGYLFIKFMRIYRNLFIQPFKIKWYK